MIVRGTNETQTGEFADELAKRFQDTLTRFQAAGHPAVRLLGPAECAVFKLQDYFRYHFQLQSAKGETIRTAIRHVMDHVKVPYGVELAIDIDPISML